MSAATLNIRSANRAWDQDQLNLHPGNILIGSVGVMSCERHCPSCQSIVYSRRHRLCGVCGQLLPAGCLFTATEAANVEMLLQTERQRHRAWLKKTTAL